MRYLIIVPAVLLGAAIALYVWAACRTRLAEDELGVNVAALIAELDELRRYKANMPTPTFGPRVITGDYLRGFMDGKDTWRAGVERSS